MTWLTNKKTGARFNTDWLDNDMNTKNRQIVLNKVEGDNVNSKGANYSKTKVLSSDGISSKVDSHVLANAQNTIAELNKQYPEIMKYIGSSGCEFKATADSKYGIMSCENNISAKGVFVKSFVFNIKDKITSNIENMTNYCRIKCGKFYMDCAESKYSKYLVSHEYGHIVQSYLLNKRYSWNFKTDKDIVNAYKSRTKDMAREFIATSKRHGIVLEHSKLSGYANKRLTEGDYTDLFAESFANMVSGKPNCWGLTMKEYLKENGL